MQQPVTQTIIEQPLFDPTYLNIEFVFKKIVDALGPVYDVLTNPQTWTVVGVVSSLLSIICLAIIIFSIIRMWEIQQHEKEEIEHEIHQALARDKERDRNANPRWHYILTLIESPNESDWRVAIIEADTMMEELLKQRGFSGKTTSELLEEAKSSGYSSIGSAWDAHIIRNQIAHQGSDFPLSQIEGRRVIKMYQVFFEDLKAI